LLCALFHDQMISCSRWYSMIVAKFFVCSLHSQVTVIIAPAYVRIVTLYLFVPLMYMPQSDWLLDYN